ncbi:MAG: hypothetical protein L6V93_05055 [Clostridiales bacterium]|nr:MAG: hypothetical protein L6V93_05055 [Clostridiales bacterium]
MGDKNIHSEEEMYKAIGRMKNRQKKVGQGVFCSLCFCVRSTRRSVSL